MVSMANISTQFPQCVLPRLVHIAMRIKHEAMVGKWVAHQHLLFQKQDVQEVRYGTDTGAPREPRRGAIGKCSKVSPLSLIDHALSATLSWSN